MTQTKLYWNFYAPIYLAIGKAPSKPRKGLYTCKLTYHRSTKVRLKK